MRSGGWALAAALLAVLGPLGAHAQEPPSREGEGGLWVEEADGEVRVGWLLAAADSGYLRLSQGDRVRWEGRTPPGVAHQVALPAPGRGRFLLQYGGRDRASRHRTVVELGSAPARAPVSVRAADSILVVADVHGEYERLVQLLGNAGVIGPDRRWRAGRSRLVLLGDLMDRGSEVSRTLWFLYALERQAAAQGGGVHVVLGNHEVMVFTGDLRYVTPPEQQLADAYGVGYTRLFDPRRSVLGRWLASKPALLKMGPVLFAHGGVSPEVAQRYSLQEHDDSLAAWMEEELFHRWSDTLYAPRMDSAAFARRFDFFWGPNSVFWYRDYVQTDTLAAALAGVLRRYRAELLVVGHTPRPRVEHRYGGELIAAHPARPALEALLLVRRGRRYERLRVGLSGPPEPLPLPAAAAGG